MTDRDRHMLDFADVFEREFLNQGMTRRTINETIDAGIDILKRFSLERNT